MVSLKYWFLKQFSSFSRKVAFLFPLYQIIDGVIKKRRKARELDNASLVCSLQVSYMTSS